VSLGSRSLLNVEFEGRSLRAVTRSLPISDLVAAPGQALLFERDGSGKLFYQARLRYARAELPNAGLDAGFYVEKRLRRVEPSGLGDIAPDAPGELAFKGGDLVVGDVLIVTSSAREFVVVDDPLPAGFEAVDTTLLTSSRNAAVLDAACRGCDGDAVASVERRELRDDRALFFVDHMGPGIHRFRYLARATSFGRFVVPPARVEEMYTPETFGRTGSMVVEVK
jgi:hypothetical protein